MPRRIWQRLWSALHPDGAALRASEARYSDLFDNVPDGLYETSVDGRILSANRALVRMLGFSDAEELKRAGPAAQYYVDPTVRAAISREMELSGAVQNREFELQSRDGRRITVLENARAVRDSEGRILHYQGTLTDITERKAAERELLSARDQALEASRLKSQFLANMSHELRTPLNAVVGMSRLLVESPLDRQQHEFAEMILHSSQFLLEIIEQLLDFARIESGRLELDRSVFRLREVVEDAVSMLAGRAADKQIELICGLRPEVPELVCGDAARLRQVLTNLVGNAVKFTETGQVEVTVRTESGHVCFEVRDSGIGIPVEAQAYIFEPFRQADGSTKRRYGGTGLGLSIARQIVERMAGRIELESGAAGTTFRFCVELEHAPGCRAVPPHQPVVLRGKRCLLLEANEAARRLTAGWLESWGVEVCADAGAEEEFDFAICATGRAESAEELEMPPAVRRLAVTPPCFLLVGVGENGACRFEGLPWVAACVSKPLRELALLETLLRVLGTAAQRTTRGEQRFAEQAPRESRTVRILAAEDNKVNQVVIRKLLERLGYEVDVVSDGLEVLCQLQAQRYDLILMDCQMPRMDGFETTAAIRALDSALQRTPIIAVTAHAIEGDRELCLQAGMDDYLTKPIQIDNLGDVIERWVDHSAGHEPSYPAIE